MFRKWSQSCHVQMGELDHREDWAPKNWCFQIGAEEDSWGSLGQQGDQTSQSLRKSTWIFLGRTDAEAEVPIIWPPDAKSWLFEKTLILGKIEGKRRRGQERTRRLDDITDSLGLSKLWEMEKDREACHATVHGVTKGQTRLKNWTTTKALFDHRSVWPSISGS